MKEHRLGVMIEGVRGQRMGGEDSGFVEREATNACLYEQVFDGAF
jgi:hypothetical protein